MKIRRFNILYRITIATILCTVLACGSVDASSKAQSIEFLLSQVRTNTGLLAGGKVYFYAAGTTTPKDVYSTRTKTVAANPYTLDANGTAQLYGDGLYRIVIKDSAGVTRYDRDNLSYYDVITSGIELVAADYASLAAAVAAIGSTETSLLINTPQSVTDSLNIPANISVRILKPGLITIASGKTLAFTGPLTAGLYQIFAGSGNVTFNSASTPGLYPEWWGAVANSSDDAAPAFRSMMASASASGGFPCLLSTGMYKLASTGTYEISKDEFTTFNLPANTALIGNKNSYLWLDGATLVNDYPPSASTRFSAVGVERGAANAKISGIHFTTNGWVTDSASRIGTFALAIMGNDYLVEDCTFINWPSHNMIIIGAANYNYLDFVVHPTGGAVKNCLFQNGSKNVPGNSLSTEASFIYTNGSGGSFTGNTFMNDSAALGNCGGLELHGDRNTVIGNTFTNLYPGMYVGKLYIGTTTQITYDNVITGNVFTGNVGGVMIPDMVDGLTITSNSFRDGVTVPDIYSSLDGSTWVSQGILTNIRISNNNFARSTAFNSGAVQLSSLQNSLVSNNNFDNYGNVVTLEGSITAATNNVSIDSNTAVRMYNPALIPTGFVLLLGSDVYVDTIKNVSIQYNMITAASASTTAYEILAVGSDTLYSNIYSLSNISSNIVAAVGGTRADEVSSDSTATYVPTWTQASGTQPDIGNGVKQITYAKKGKSVNIQFVFIAGTTTTYGNSGTAWVFSLPFPVSSTIGTNYGIAMVNDAAGAVYPMRIYLEQGTSNLIFQSTQSVTLGFPFVSASGMFIQASFNYYTD